MSSSRSEIVQSLQSQLAKGIKRRMDEPICSGSPALDARARLRRGTLVECLGDDGGGATTLATVIACQACRDDRPLMVIDQQRRIYPPALAAMKLNLRRVVFAFPTSPRDYEWCLTQALGCPAIGAVLCWPDNLDDRAFRRLQLSAEQGGGVGLLVRSAAAVHEPSWADARLLIQPVPFYGRRRMRIEVLRSRGIGVSGRSVEVEICPEGLLHDARPVHPVPRLAASTTAQRAARA